MVELAEAYVSILPDSEKALTYACKAFEVDAADENVRALLEKIAVDNGMYEALVRFYGGQVDNIEELELAQIVRHRMADIYELELELNQEAIDVHMKIIEFSPSDSESLESLERLYKELGFFTELAEVYQHRVEQAETDSARVALMRELSRIRSDLLGETDVAITILCDLLIIEQQDIPALKKLAVLYEGEAADEKAQETLQRLIEASADNEPELLQANLELARMRFDKLDRENDAFSLLDENVRTVPTHEKTRSFLRERLELALTEELSALALRYAELNTIAMRAGPEARELV